LLFFFFTLCVSVALWSQWLYGVKQSLELSHEDFTVWAVSMTIGKVCEPNISLSPLG